MRRPPRNRPLRNRLIRTEPRAECRPWGFWLVGTFVVADLCVLLGFAGARLSDPKTLPIREVFIEGEFRQLKPPDLEALVAHQVRGGFFTVRVAEVQRGLRRDPWVKAASVSRQWPDGLRVTVYEERAVARFGARGLLNPEGVLFSPPAASYPAGLPLLEGPEGTEAQVLARYNRLAELLDRAGLLAQGLAQDARGSWRFVLRDGPLVLVGREDFEPRVKRFVAHYHRIAQSGRGVVARVDLRHTNGIAVSFRSEAVPAAHRPPPSSSLRGLPVKRPDKDLVVGLDIGTSKVVAIVGESTGNGAIEVIGVGSNPSRGLRRGVVVNIESTVQSIQRAIEEAELMAGCEIRSVYAGIAGSHIRSFNSHGIVAIRDSEVTDSDVDRVIDAARAVAIPADQKVLHVLPQEFIIDKQEGIREPVGMSGVRLEAKVHLVSGAVSAAQNIVKCVRRCGLEVDDMILQQLASSEAVLTDDEKELGVCLADIGGGTTDIAVFIDGAVHHTAVIPIAGDQVTNDIAVALRTPTHNAEEIKIKYACALTQLASPEETIEVPSVGDRRPRRLMRQTLSEVVEPRYEELFNLIQAELKRSGFEEMMAAGVVLTGGSAKIEGAVELAEEVFHRQVRLGLPQGVNGLVDVVKNPVFSTGVGLLIFGCENEQRGHRPLRHNGGVWERMKGWFQGNF